MAQRRFEVGGKVGPELHRHRPGRGRWRHVSPADRRCGRRDGCGCRWPALSVFRSKRCRPRKARASNCQTAMSAKRSCCATSKRPSCCASMRLGPKTGGWYLFGGGYFAVRTSAKVQTHLVDNSIESGTRDDASDAIERYDQRLGGRRRLRYRPVHRGGGTLRAGAVERESRSPTRSVSPTAPSRSWSAFATDYFFATDQVPSIAALPLAFSRSTQVPLHALPSKVAASTTSAPSAAGKS